MTNIEKLMDALPDERTCAVITDETNRRYFTGFKSSDGIVVCFKDKAYFIIDFRYYEKAAQRVKGMEVILQKEKEEQLAELFVMHCAEVVMTESDTMTVTELRKFTEEFGEDLYIDSSSALSDIINGFRLIKSEDEIRKILDAQSIAEETYLHVLSNIRRGMTEREVALMTDNKMKLLGAEDISFETIVLFGKNTSLPHGVPGNDILESGFVLMDFGAVIDGYHSDMTRTFYAGAPSDEEKRAYDIVLQAQQAALDAARPEMHAAELDAVARNIIDSTEFKGSFGHSLGHGVGMEIHEMPRVSAKSDYILKEGMVITIEPGIYLPGKFGIRTENMGVITADSFMNFTKSSREFTVL